jgi:hypothetical protein
MIVGCRPGQKPAPDLKILPGKAKNAPGVVRSAKYGFYTPFPSFQTILEHRLPNSDYLATP